MDAELQELLIEIRNKDWEQELDIFKEEIQLEKINQQRFSLQFLKDYQEYFYPLLLASILGLFISTQTAIVLYVLQLIFLCIYVLYSKLKHSLLAASLIGLIGGSFFVNIVPLLAQGSLLASFFGICMASGIGILLSLAMMYRFDVKPIDVFPILASYEFLGPFPLQPEDLLRFWESKMGIYIAKKKVDLKFLLKNIYQKKEELNLLLLELSEFEDLSDHSAKDGLLRSLQEAQSTEDDMVHVMETLSLMERGFLKKIGSLKFVIEEKEELERKLERRKTLHLRINQAIGAKALDKKTWELEKKKMQVELQSMMTVFHAEILHSGDFFQAQLELTEDKGSLIDE
ncbi:UbiA family prenyltransferase [bacterium]|nr:UbiA family prenyltransferase [bacterium]